MNPGIDILYLGHEYGTSLHRAEALRRLGNKVTILDPWDFTAKHKLLKKIIEKLVYEAGAAWLEAYIRQRLVSRLKDCHFDLVWSDQCVLVGPTTAAALRCCANYMVTYAIDDPFGTRDKNRFAIYRKSLSLFDLVVVVREANVTEAFMHGARNVLRVFMSADEVAHHPILLTPENEKRWPSNVVFIGTWMPERGPFLERLIELGVPITLYGDRWQKAREWSVIKRFWRGANLVGKDYVKAIQTAKVCLGLLSKGNRDLHTSRSAEIPYIGSLLCAERTGEHMTMYREGKEAVFWSTPEECAEKCFTLLSNESVRKAIARAGRERCLQDGYLNEPIMKTILNRVLKNQSVPTHYRLRSEKVVCCEEKYIGLS